MIHVDLKNYGFVGATQRVAQENRLLQHGLPLQTNMSILEYRMIYVGRHLFTSHPLPLANNPRRRAHAA